MGLAPDFSLATHCIGHCSMSVAQGIKGPCGFDVILTFLPPLNQQVGKSEARSTKPETLLCFEFRYSNFEFPSLRAWRGAVFRDTCNAERGLRSLPHLRERFKVRADDNHAAPVQPS